jgi:hypothetical protein
VLDGGQRCKRSDLDAASLLANPVQFRNVADVEHVLGLEQFLPHGWDEVGASGDDSEAVVFRQVRDRFIERARAQQFELWETQSSPPV